MRMRGVYRKDMTQQECPACRREFETEHGYEIHLLGHKVDAFSGIMERFISWFEKASKREAETLESLK